MSSGLYIWSQTAASNANADSTINWAEGQAPSSVNDSARAMMAGVAKYRDDIAGAIVTGGTSTAYTVTSYQVFDSLAHLNGQMIAFTPNATNTNAVGVDVTLSVDSLTAKPIRMQPSIALPNGTLVLGTPYIVTYNNSDGVFYLQNMTNPYLIPLGAGMDFWGTTAPNTSFAFPTGQAVSRTTYATLFSILGTTFGSGDGSTTFNLPDKTGRASVMKEASATRLTTAGGGVDGGTLGATGGAQNETIAQANLPSVNFTVTGTVTPQVSGNATLAVANGSASSGVATGGSFNVYRADTAYGTVNNVVSLNAASGGSGTALKTVQPTIVCNYIMRII